MAHWRENRGDRGEDGRVRHCCRHLRHWPVVGVFSEGLPGCEQKACPTVFQILTRPYCQTISVNLHGTLFAAQAAGRQMSRFGNGGSVIMIASICGSIALEVRYHLSVSITKGLIIRSLLLHSHISPLLHTTRRSPGCCRWHAVWPASSARSTSG